MGQATFLVVVCVLLVGPLCSNAQLTLQLDPFFSPLADMQADFVYNSPENDHMLAPVKVKVLADGVNPVTGPVVVTATSILASSVNTTSSTVDTYLGILCQHNKWTHRFRTCRYLDDGCIELNCNTTDPAYPKGKVEVTSENGIAVFERLLHTKYTGADHRRLRFDVEYNGTSATVYTNAFRVDLAAASLEIVVSSVVNGNIGVNEPLNFTLQTMAEDPSSPGSLIPLVTGRHSFLNVDLTVAWDFKIFYLFFPQNVNFYQIYSSSVTLAGSDVKENGRLDLTIRKQCFEGSVTFTDVRILEEVTNLQLNFTQTLPYYPWERVPPNYNETQIIIVPSSTFTTTVSQFGISPAVVFTQPFNVTYGVMASLEFEPDSLANFVPNADANFQFVTPIKVQAISSNGQVITDGPDSRLNVTTHISNSSCLTIDSDFALVRGEGTFPGSICEVGSGFQLRFSVTDNLGVTYYTPWTTSIDVTGDFKLAAIFSINAEVNFVLFTEAAMTLVNRGYWDPDFTAQGRKLGFDYYWVQSSSPQEALDAYDKIRAKNLDPWQPTVRSIIGAVGEEDTIALSRASRRHEMPIMGYQSERGDLSDKSAHPFYNRISYSDRVKFFAEGAYLASHRWNNVIVIKDSDHPIPVDMYRGFEAHGVSIVLELTVPSLSAEPADISALEPLDNLAEQVKGAGTRIIYSYVFQPSDIYLYQESIRLEFAPSFGYQWLGIIYILTTFPFANDRGDCASLTPTCTTAFNSTISFAPSNEVDITNALWSEALYDAYTQVDPLKLPSATIWRWPSVYGGISKPHDGAVATVLGAMDIIRRQETITGPKLAISIRNVSFEGGSGNIMFDENGDQPGFTAAIYNFNPISDYPTGSTEAVWVPGTWNIDPITQEVTERQYGTRPLSGNVVVSTGMSYAPISYQNERDVKGYRPGSTVLEEINDLVPAAYWCSDGCGGGLADNTNGTIYYFNYGTCASQDNCVCKNKFNSTEPGYAGSSCQQILCDPQCRNGLCTEPDVCICEPYWSGVDCGTPLCPVSGCDSSYGTCTGPNICTCQSGNWGSDCTQRCTCVNGICNDGQSGTGICSECLPSYTGANCDLSIPLVVVPTLVVVIALVIGIIILSIWYIRRMRFRAALANNDWIVDYNDVVVICDDQGGANSMAFRSMVSLAADTQRQKDVVRNQGKWNGIEVSIKMIDKDLVAINTTLRLEVKAMRDIRHQNLASFVGACCDTPNLCILMQTAPKGSLDDILSVGSIQLDWNFKYALLKDICRGMNYLSNTPIKSHGRLKSSNCVIDNRWTLRITDYGMHTFKSNQNGVPKFNPLTAMANENLEDGISSSTLTNLLYTAPEILRSGVTHLDHVESGSIQGDMYSFGIILCEVLTMEAPFQDCLDYVEVKDVLDAIAGRKSLTSELPSSLLSSSSKHFRPNIPDDADKDFVKLMMSTWDEDPLQRPTFQQALKELNSISPQRGDLMDNLVSMLEKYSTNLEAVVAERTQELVAEKAKTEELVCRMLPRAIAEQLKRGEIVSAETFECVSIYFSDIVGFTKIAGGSTPLQVVDLLNDLYTCFDAIIDHFDVYKVETIGDAYMVVSGLPIRNGDQHAGEVASMSLHLLSAILSFKIRHMPETKLQLRIGIHSGPCVAGVVGLKMPRYCLFGDTVNTASRMESGGLALKVHMSESTAKILEKLGGYHLESRGEREVKGKGIMRTYWLKNKDGFSRPLPSEDMAVSASQHEFK